MTSGREPVAPDSENKDAYNAWIEEMRMRDLEKEKENYEVRQSEIEGSGWFAKKNYAIGEKISHYIVGRYEDVRRGDAIEEGSEFDHGAVQCGVTEDGDALYIGVPHSPRRFINHSCEPNAGIQRAARPEGGWDSFIIAIREVNPGDEVTLDYSTTQLDHWQMEGCKCGKPACRGMITDFGRIAPGLQEKYIRLGIIPKWMSDAVQK